MYSVGGSIGNRIAQQRGKGSISEPIAETLKPLTKDIAYGENPTTTVYKIGPNSIAGKGSDSLIA